jgi:hypothetical protein
VKSVGKDGGGAVEVVTWAGIAQTIQSGDGGYMLWQSCATVTPLIELLMK